MSESALEGHLYPRLLIRTRVFLAIYRVGWIGMGCDWKWGYLGSVFAVATRSRDVPDF